MRAKRIILGSLGIFLLLGSLTLIWFSTRPPQPIRRSTATTPSQVKKPLPNPIATGLHQRYQGELALVIDDFGTGNPPTNDALGLPFPITIAVIPYQPRSTEIARQAHARGDQVILHCPMQPINGALRIPSYAIGPHLSESEIQRRLLDEIAQTPGLVGVNNHMGSLATGDTRVMRTVLEVIRERGLFFLDSMTSPRSVSRKEALELGVPWGTNRLFIDNQDNRSAIVARVVELAALADREGAVIGIGHVRKETITALQTIIPELQKRGLKMVLAADVIRRLSAKTR